jgi:hypothetical protein
MADILKRYNITPISILGITHNQVGISAITIDPTVPSATVTVSMFTTVDEQIPSFTRVITITNSQYAALGFNLNTLLTQLKTLCNIP